MADSDVSDTDPVADAPKAEAPTSAAAAPATQTERVAESVTEDETPPTTPAAPTVDPILSAVTAMADKVEKILAVTSGLQATFVDGGGIVRDDFVPSAASGANTAQGQTQDAAGVNQTSEDVPLEELDFTL